MAEIVIFAIENGLLYGMTLQDLISALNERIDNINKDALKIKEAFKLYYKIQIRL